MKCENIFCDNSKHGQCVMHDGYVGMCEARKRYAIFVGKTEREIKKLKEMVPVNLPDKHLESGLNDRH